ncbi:hypothetical protein XENOCAPTIV_006466, partial [Xenoophorus captivus]
QPRCANTDGSLIGISLITTRILLLFPVSVFILCHGLQQRWQLVGKCFVPTIENSCIKSSC